MAKEDLEIRLSNIGMEWEGKTLFPILQKFN